jgi:hypothetical protein
MTPGRRLSVTISETTRKSLEKHVRRTGIQKRHLIEQALLHYLQAQNETWLAILTTKKAPTRR